MIKNEITYFRENGLLSTIDRIFWIVLMSHLFKNRFLSSVIKLIIGKQTHRKVLAYRSLGYWPRIENPKTFNEKILHRHFYTDNELFTTVEGKHSVREYVREKVNGEILPEVYQVTDDPGEIAFHSLPAEYVVKPTHLAGGEVILVDENGPTKPEIRRQCDDWLDQTHGVIYDQYWYWDIKPEILIEERLQDDKYGVPPDFKFFVFHGRVEYVRVDYNRWGEQNRRFYDPDWEPQDFQYKDYPLAPPREKPSKFEEMVEIAEILGEEFDFIRCDLYLVNDSRIVFGELTVGPANGHGVFSPAEYDLEFGNHWRY